MNTNKFISLYKAFEERARPAAAGRGGNGGKAFLPEDRATLVEAMRTLRQTPVQLGYAICQELGGNVARHAQRLRIFAEQVQRGDLVMGYEPINGATGERHPASARITLQVGPDHKQMTVDVAHRLVAFDCELGSLQAQYENYRENAMKELDRQLDVIQTLTHEMNALKAEYNVA